MSLTTATFVAVSRLRHVRLGVVVAAFLATGATGHAATAGDVRWATRTVLDVTVEIPDHWVVKEDLGDGELEFLESDDPDAASFAVFRDADLTDLGDGAGLIATSSAIVGGEIGRRSDWRRGGRRGATIVLSERGSEGGRLGIHFSAAQKDWNRVRPLFRHAVRSIRFRTAPAAVTAEKKDPPPAATAPKQPAPKAKKRRRAAERKTPAKPRTAAFKKVAGTGFTLRIPQNWQWERLQDDGETVFTTGDDARHIALRFGILPRDVGVDESLDAFIDAARMQLAYDELVESVDLTDDTRWNLRETYDGEATDGTLVTLKVTLNDRVEPAVVMALMAPSEPSQAVVKILGTVTESLSFTDTSVPDAATPADGPTAEAPSTATQPARQPAELAATTPATEETPEEPAAAEPAPSEQSSTAADAVPQAPASDDASGPPAIAETPKPAEDRPQQVTETAEPAEPSKPAAEETSKQQSAALAPAPETRADEAPQAPAADQNGGAPAQDTVQPFDPAAASAESATAEAPVDAETQQSATPPPGASATNSGERPAAAQAEPPATPVQSATEEPAQRLASVPDSVADAAPAAPDVYQRAVAEHGFLLRVPDGWTIQEDRRDKADSWRLRDKSWRAGNGSSGLFSVTATISPAKRNAKPETLFRQTVEHFSTTVLKDAVTVSEGRTAFANREMFHADIAGILDADTDRPYETILRVVVDRWDDKLVVVTAFAPAGAPQALSAVMGPQGFVAPLAAQ